MQCKCVKYSEIGSEIQQHLKKRMLLDLQETVKVMQVRFLLEKIIKNI